MSVKILGFKLEAQIDPLVVCADEQRGLPQCVVAVAPHVAAPQQRTPITLWDPSYCILHAESTACLEAHVHGQTNS